VKIRAIRVIRVPRRDGGAVSYAVAPSKGATLGAFICGSIISISMSFLIGSVEKQMVNNKTTEGA